MQGEAFYKAFKDALEFFGIEWANKNLMEVDAYKGKIMFTYGNIVISIDPNDEVQID